MFEFLSTAAEMKTIPEGEEFDDDRTFYKINVSGYLMNVDKPELLQSFISNMYDRYLDKKNFTQAALSLELLANTYSWNPTTFLPPCEAPRFPSQSEFKRKEALFRLIAANYCKGNKVDQAVETYQELLDAYNKFNFDLKGLSYCHTELAKSFTLLETSGRMDSSYFKISFIGLGFPPSIRGKEFIYEGMPFEHITSINHRLTRMYPGSRIISNEDDAKKLLLSTPFGKYLHIKTVIPFKHSGADMSHLTFTARQYVDNKNLNTFVSTRRLAGSTNVSNLWTEETTYETLLTFPTLMNRSEIKSVDVIKLSPIKNAVKSLIEKNEELSNLEFLIKQNLREGIDASTIAGSSVFNNLSRILAGTVDSPVNGGVGQYRAFFNVKSDEPDFDINVQYLKNSFNNLIILLNKLLKLHHALIPSNLKPQHQLMVELFSKNFRVEIQELKLDVKSTLNLDKLLKSLLSTNIFSRRYQQQRLVTSDGRPLDFGSNSGSGSFLGGSSSHNSSSFYNNRNGVDDGMDDDDTSSSLSGSLVSNSRSAHSTGSGSKLSGSGSGSGIGSGTASSTNFSGYSNGGIGGNGRLASGGKRTILNFK
ncbi:unnamed protein product [Ambrosiozyma monospora]|uniref:Unnamed protein product n=1 Tax=Ambrosiozyma monospora TaxID=43982 RepID=A0A9W6Z2K9_AMBMO|nr:unnamed protein product [Ambrosiozyma monospora]